MTTERSIYINAAEQISCQAPISLEWMENPVVYEDEFVRSLDPNFKSYFPPLVARKMGILLKRAVVTSLEAMKRAGNDMPDAIITGTGLGCVQNTEAFLSAITQQGEELLTPTNFMQSTHNTIGSMIAIYTHNHGYNTTYSQKGVSFESALWDAYLQLKAGSIENALVGSHDEVTPAYFSMLKKIGYVGNPGQVQCSEASVSMYLSCNPENALCQIDNIKMIYHPDRSQILEILKQDEWDAVMLGLNHNPKNDECYSDIVNVLSDVCIPIAVYKNIFGENYSASALGLYALAHCLHAGYIPPALSLNGEKIGNLRNVLFINHSDGGNYTFVRLRDAKK